MSNSGSMFRTVRLRLMIHERKGYKENIYIYMYSIFSQHVYASDLQVERNVNGSGIQYPTKAKPKTDETVLRKFRDPCFPIPIM